MFKNQLKSFYFVLVSSLLLIIITLIIVYSTQPSQNNTVSIQGLSEVPPNGLYKIESPKSHFPESLTFLQAYHLSISLCRQYDSECLLSFMNSVDDKKVTGEDGKKNNWQGLFTMPLKKKHIVIAIENGILKNYEILDITDEYTIPESRLKVDSNVIVKKAINHWGLKPSPIDDLFSHGFHFRVLRDNKNIYFSVDGKSNGKTKEIFYDPTTGHYLGHTMSK